MWSINTADSLPLCNHYITSSYIFHKLFSTELGTCRNTQAGLAWSSALLQGPALECLGCGVMMYTRASVVQFTLGAECKHVHVTFRKLYRWGSQDWWQPGKESVEGEVFYLYLTTLFNQPDGLSNRWVLETDKRENSREQLQASKCVPSGNKIQSLA